MKKNLWFWVVIFIVIAILIVLTFYDRLTRASSSSIPTSQKLAGQFNKHT